MHYTIAGAPSLTRAAPADGDDRAQQHAGAEESKVDNGRGYILERLAGEREVYLGVVILFFYSSASANFVKRCNDGGFRCCGGVPERYPGATGGVLWQIIGLTETADMIQWLLS